MNKLLVACAALLIAPISFAQTCSTTQVETHADGQFIDRLDGTILDAVNGLIWSKCNLGEQYLAETNTCQGSPTHFATWEKALVASNNPDMNTIGDKDGFRLPNIKELGSLVAYECVSPAIDLDYFQTTVNIPYWSSTPDSTNINPAPGYEGLVIDFYDGQEVDTGMSGIIAVRLVKEIL